MENKKNSILVKYLKIHYGQKCVGLASCAFLRLKKVLLIIKLVSFLIICSIYILILHRPEGQDPKQYRILLVEQIKLQNFQWD